MLDLAALIPVGKFDTVKAEAIVTLGFPAVEPILPALLHWMQDMNWPVAKVLQPFLASIGAPLASIPLIAQVFGGSPPVVTGGITFKIPRPQGFVGSTPTGPTARNR